MSGLTAMCERIGFSNVRTYIASGNVVFDTPMPERQVKRKLETELERCAKKPVAVLSQDQRRDGGHTGEESISKFRA
jgi:uncharacterized protein (DUF1697 family)